MGPKLAIYRSFRAHKAHIMDLVEIISPTAIATCSLDHRIKLWDLSTGQKLGTLQPEHTTGVRSLDYTPDFSGCIVSVGHENIIKVWSPEVSIDRAYVGCLEGHNAAVMSAKFIKYSPYLVSIDEKLNLRVWDIRSLSCVQVISQTHKRYYCNGICILGAQHKFVLYGRRLVMYDTVLDKVGKKEVKPADDAYPFKVEFNMYYKTFVVATKMDVRLYDCATGQLIKIFSNFARDSKPAELTSFCMDAKHRKFYVGDAYGSVRAYNVSSGVFIKSVGEEEAMYIAQPTMRDFSKKKDKNKLRGEVLKEIKKDHTGEISGLYYVKDDQLLLTTSFDSTMNIYDDENPDMTPRLRNLSGGHAGSPITCLEYSEHLALIATGGSNGYITIWDYEMSRIEGICSGHAREILALKFLDPYPLLLSSSTEGVINLWAVRGAPLHSQYTCLCSFLNIHEQDFGAVPLSIPSIVVFQGVQPAIEVKESLYEGKTEADLRKSYLKSMGGYDGGSNKGKRRRLSLEEEKKIGFFCKEKLLAPPDYAKGRKMRTYVVMGDEKGRVRILDFTNLIKTLGVNQVKRYRDDTPHSFNPKRKENNDFSSRIGNELRKLQFKTGPYVISELTILVNEWEGHKDQICSISKIDQPEGFVTASLDRHVKIWSKEGQQWGDIATYGENPVIRWEFPYDWSDEREKDKERVVEMLKEIEPNQGYAKEKIEYDDSGEVRKIRLTKKGQWDRIVPKRSIIKPLATDLRLKAGEVYKERGPKKYEEERALRKPRGKEDADARAEAPLVQDIGAFIDMYKESPDDRKGDLIKSLEQLQERLHKETSEAISVYSLSKPFTADPSARRKEMMSMHFAKVPPKEDIRTLHNRYAISSMKSGVFRRAKSKPITRLPSATRAKTARGFTQCRNDKFGRTGYLEKMDVVRLVRGNTATGNKRPRNVKYNVNEIERQFRKSTSSIRMRKEADIRNYNPADNDVLKKQLQLIRSFDALPKFGPRKKSMI